jgi:hypothetical protein
MFRIALSSERNAGPIGLIIDERPWQRERQANAFDCR